MHACITFRIISTSASPVVLTNMNRHTAVLQLFLAIFLALSRNNKRESKYIASQHIDNSFAIGLIFLFSTPALVLGNRTISGLRKLLL